MGAKYFEIGTWRKRAKLSYDNSWGGITFLEEERGLGRILSCSDARPCGMCLECERREKDDVCSCGMCKECECRDAVRKKEIEDSIRFKEGAKLVAGISGNRKIKLALIQKVHKSSLDYAIVRYMTKEALPKYYAAILKSPNCIDSLVEGILYKICKIQPAHSLAEQIGNLSRSLRSNPSRLTAYDRVTHIQQFIHCTVDKYLWEGAAQSIPMAPMKNALSAARLHLSILDVIDRRPGYVAYIDSLSSATFQLEYDEPRPSTAPLGKRSWPKWRVRHLRPLSYYFEQERRTLLQSLNNLDENVAVAHRATSTIPVN